MEVAFIKIPITPQTHIRSTYGDRIIFRVPEDCPHNCGLPRRSKNSEKVEVKTMAATNPKLWKAIGGNEWKQRIPKRYIRFGCPHMLSEEGLKRKRQLERYNQYKDAVKALCDQAGFKMPVAGWAVYFFIPIPKSYSAKKRAQLHGQHHLLKPDIDNLMKAMFDSLSVDDQKVAHLSGVGKFWIDAPVGYIEINGNTYLHNPFGVEFIDQIALKAAPKRNWVKKATEDKRKNRKKKALNIDPRFLTDKIK